MSHHNENVNGAPRQSRLDQLTYAEWQMAVREALEMRAKCEDALADAREELRLARGRLAHARADLECLLAPGMMPEPGSGRKPGKRDRT